jgi:hypothetical protein
MCERKIVGTEAVIEYSSLDEFAAAMEHRVQDEFSRDACIVLENDAALSAYMRAKLDCLRKKAG